MAKFLNKKEDVFDIKLTSYGKHLLGIGKFKPVYYAFFDDNIIYDKNWTSGSEVQNETHKRIKEDTQYIEGYTTFQELENNINRDGIEEVNFFSVDIEPSAELTRKDLFKFDQALGDAFLQGETQVAPAWKIASMTNTILSSSYTDEINNSRVPQIYISSSYKLKIIDSIDYYNDNFNSLEPRKYELVTEQFMDGKVIYLENEDPLIYFEELNTELLNKNFEIEVFEVVDSKTTEEFQGLKRKYFTRREEQIKNGLMMYANEVGDTYGIDNSYFIGDEQQTNKSVSYYFDLVLDRMINEKLACKAAEHFNNSSYYIDIDFQCDGQSDEEDIFYDIYGSAVEAEICLD